MAKPLDLLYKCVYLIRVVKGTPHSPMKKAQRSMTPAELATLMKIAELRTKGAVSTCDFYGVKRRNA